MTLINRFHLNSYITVFIATIIICAVFLISVNFNSKQEHTYQMTDHTISNYTIKNEHKHRTADVKDKESNQGVQYAYIPLVAKEN
ncbi:DNA damage-induced cell division inhibitor SosA [Staphylococcus marylandisciuri]|nr:DNA damage-induced cell division inhibitor SosA [Staphylococcus marylandisciuri]